MFSALPAGWDFCGPNILPRLSSTRAAENSSDGAFTANGTGNGAPYSDKGWIGITLRAPMDWPELHALVQRSYDMTAPKRLAKARR